MRRSRYSEEQIIRILERAESGEQVKDLCHKSTSCVPGTSLVSFNAR